MNQQQFSHPAHGDERTAAGSSTTAAVAATKASAVLQHRAAAAAAAAALCMHINLTPRLLRRHLNHHRTYIYAGTKK